MVGKREMSEDVYGFVLQCLRDRVKAGLPESQCPVVEPHSSVTRLESDASASHGFEFCSWYALRNGRCVANAFKGMSGAPTSRSKRFSVTEHGIAYGPRGLGSRSSNSSRGSDAPPGSAGKPRAG